MTTVINNTKKPKKQYNYSKSLVSYMNEWIDTESQPRTYRKNLGGPTYVCNLVGLRWSIVFYQTNDEAAKVTTIRWALGVLRDGRNENDVSIVLPGNDTVDNMINVTEKDVITWDVGTCIMTQTLVGTPSTILDYPQQIYTTSGTVKTKRKLDVGDKLYFWYRVDNKNSCSIKLSAQYFFQTPK